MKTDTNDNDQARNWQRFEHLAVGLLVAVSAAGAIVGLIRLVF